MSDKQWSQIVAKAWADANFKKRLLADPAAALKEGGMDVPAGVMVKVVENSDKVIYLTLPARQSSERSEDELSDKELESVAGGATLVALTDLSVPAPRPEGRLK